MSYSFLLLDLTGYRNRQTAASRLPEQRVLMILLLPPEAMFSRTGRILQFHLQSQHLNWIPNATTGIYQGGTVETTLWLTTWQKRAVSQFRFSADSFPSPLNRAKYPPDKERCVPPCAASPDHDIPYVGERQRRCPAFSYYRMIERECNPTFYTPYLRVPVNMISGKFRMRCQNALYHRVV